MKIIFNSDILYATNFLQNLPNKLEIFLKACIKDKHHIIFPLTTLYEFNRKQEEFRKKEIQEINGSIKKLERYNLLTSRTQNIEESVPLIDLISMIKVLGLSCDIEEATLDDYNNAHRKACLRENPHPPEIKSDEMRDLVIWEISLRIANDNKGAILMSQDVVHIHQRGDSEAKENQLIRCKSYERAKESLSIETYAAKVIKKLIESVFEKLVASKFPIENSGHIASIENPVFSNTDYATTIVYCNVKFISGAGEHISSFLKMEYQANVVIQLDFNNIEIHTEKIVKQKDIEINIITKDTLKSDYESKVTNLKNIIKG